MNKNKKEAILYVDDEQHNLNGFKLAFMNDFRIHTALSVDIAMDTLRKEEIKVIVSDQRMPAQTGLEFFQNIQKEFPDIIKIILTAYVDIDVILEAVNKN